MEIFFIYIEYKKKSFNLSLFSSSVFIYVLRDFSEQCLNF